jgi:hypothetical protein
MRKKVECSFCGKEIVRQTWNYGRDSPIDNFFCGNGCKGKWQIKQRESLGFTKEWLESEYLEKGKSANMIAREIGRDPKSVWRWITDYGIKTRPRGNFYNQGFKKGGCSPFKGKVHSIESRNKIRKKCLEDGRVPYLINGEHWLKATGRKPASWAGGISPDRQAFYSTEEWCSAVKAVWKRDKGVCQRCGVKHNEGNRGTFHIHHIVSFLVKSKRSDVDNLVLLCKKCHLFIHSNKNKDKLLIGGNNESNRPSNK